MTEQSTHPHTSGGRRAATAKGRRVDVLVALAIGLPAVVAVGLGLIGNPETPRLGDQPPTVSSLTTATVICPTGPGDAPGDVRAGRGPGVPGGDLTVLTSDVAASELAAPAPLSAVAGKGTTLAVPGSSGATVLQGEGASAPGIVAGRGDRLAVPECRGPAYDEWLVGLGASARYASTLELVNPDVGEAVLDVVLFDESGPVDEPALRGLQVPGHGVQRIDLASVAPRRTITAAHLIVTRGRVSATARTTRDPLGRGRVTTDFLPSQAAPADDNLILGIPSGAKGATLFVANPGDNEVRALVRLVTAESTFTPTGSAEITIGPHALQTVALSPILAGDAGAGAVGLRIESDAPVVASARMVSARDLVLLAPVVDVREPTAAVLPTGDKTLVLGDARRAGVVHVTSYAADGSSLGEEQIEVAPDRAASFAVPATAVLITVEPRNTAVGGVVVMPGTTVPKGLATLRLRPLETQARVPSVRP